MSFTRHWTAKVKANPDLTKDETKLRLSVREFRRQLEIAYLAGCCDTRRAMDDVTDPLRKFFGM